MQIEEYGKVIETINAIINNKGIAEIKIEHEKRLVVVEVGRSIRCSEPIKDVENGTQILR